MNKLLSRVRYVLVSLMFAGTMTATSLTPVFADSVSATSPLAYSGQGFPITQQCGEGTDTPAGSMLFIFSYGGNYDPTNIMLNGITVLSQEENGNETHIFTTYSSDLTSLKQNVNVTWGGSVGNAQLVISHGCAPVVKTPVTPATVSVTENCGTENDSYVIPNDGNGVTYTKTYVNGVLTVTATPDSTHTLLAGNNFTLNQDGTATFTYTFTNVDCPDLCKNIVGIQSEVPNNMVRGDDGNCYKKVWVCKYVGTPGVDERLKTGNDGLINVSVNAIEHNKWDGNVPGWFSDAQDRSYVLAYDNGQPKPSTTECPQPPCECHEQHKVTAPDVKFRDKCGMDMDKFVIPSKTGVKYKVNGEVIAAGTYNAYDYDVNGTVTVTAHAKSGYVLEGQDEWSYTFTNKDCKVRADKPMFKDLCETRNDTYTIPTTEHVYYTVNGTPKDAGTYPATGTVTIIAHADEGYKIKGKTSWTYTFTNESCGGGQGGDNPVTPAAVTFNDVCATANDTYTIPSTAGVVYKVGGNVVAAGTYSGTGTVTVMAEATSGHVLTGTATWTYDFTNVACPGGSGGGFVLGDSFTPTPTAQPQVLANTGSSSVASTLVAVFVMITALAVYAFNPKFETR